MEHAVSYLRVSGDSQIDGGGFPRQRDKIAAFAAVRGFELVREYREEGVSGKIDCEKRPAFQLMLAELLSNGCRTVIVEDLSRLARRYAVQEQILIYLCAKGITLWTCANGGDNITEAISADPTRRLVIGMMGLISQWEREQIVAKLRAAKERKKATGAKAEGRKAYGENADELPILTRMQAGRELGHTFQQIADALNADGIPSRMGGPWRVGTVARILGRG